MDIQSGKKVGSNVLGDSPCIYASGKKRSTAADRRTEKRNSSKKFKKKTHLAVCIHAERLIAAAVYIL